LSKPEKENRSTMRALLGILICLCAQQALADTRYVSDNIFTYIHNGPGTQYRILGSVKAGEPLEVKAVNSEAGFTQVVDGRGREGWIKNSELQSQISLRERLPQVEKERDELKDRLQNLNGCRTSTVTTRNASPRRMARSLPRARRSPLSRPSWSVRVRR